VIRALFHPGHTIRPGRVRECETEQATFFATRPADFNAVIVGAPANFLTHLTASAIWRQVIDNHRGGFDPGGFVPPAKLELLHKAVLEACDATQLRN